MTAANLKLMSDLAALAARYPPEDWEALIAALEDPQKRDQTRVLLVELASASRRRRETAGARSRSPRSNRARDALRRLRAEDPAQAAALEELWRKLRLRELLPTMTEVKAFADAIGMKDLRSEKREQAIGEIVERLVETPDSDLEEMLRDAAVPERALGSEYERWVQLILRQRPEDQPEQRDTQR